jgi:nitrogen regulatory protein PII
MQADFEKHKRLEIIIESIKVEKIAEILEDAGVSGYTIVGNIMGKGPHGVKDHNCKAKIFENTYIFTVCTQIQVDSVIPKVREILKYYSGACFISEAEKMILPFR